MNKGEPEHERETYTKGSFGCEMFVDVELKETTERCDGNHENVLRPNCVIKPHNDGWDMDDSDIVSSLTWSPGSCGGE